VGRERISESHAIKIGEALLARKKRSKKVSELGGKKLHGLA